MMDVHIKLKLKGTTEQLSRFHSICKQCDNDWPYVTLEPDGKDVRYCECCKGLVYRRPLLSAHDIVLAGRQVGLRSVKIKRYAHATACNGKPPFVIDEPSTEGDIISAD